MHPPYEPTEGQRDNTTALLGLLATEDVAIWLEVSELHRELGQPQQAQDALNQAGGFISLMTMTQTSQRLVRQRVASQMPVPAARWLVGAIQTQHKRVPVHG